jgi:hypothetical protein
VSFLGENATKSMYTEKAEGLRKIGDPIAFRAREFGIYF